MIFEARNIRKDVATRDFPRKICGSVAVFCDYGMADGIWNYDWSDSAVLDETEYVLSAQLFNDLAEWNTIYEVLNLGFYAASEYEKECPIEEAQKIAPGFTADDFTDRGKELACRVKQEAPNCRVYFFDEIESNRAFSLEAGSTPGFGKYEVLPKGNAFVFRSFEDGREFDFEPAS